jgi:hypothetical protein
MAILKRILLTSCGHPGYLQDVLNDYILGKLDAIRKQPIPTLFAKPEQGPASVEMVSRLILILKSYLK